MSQRVYSYFDTIVIANHKADAVRILVWDGGFDASTVRPNTHRMKGPFPIVNLDDDGDQYGEPIEVDEAEFVETFGEGIVPASD